MARADPPISEAEPIPVLYLDGSGWHDALGFCEALYDLVGGPRPAACSVQAVVDSMVWSDVRLIEPPYHIVVQSLSEPAVREWVVLCGHCIAEGCKQYAALNGEDVKVSLELAS